MGYILGLFLILGILFYSLTSFTGNNLFGNLMTYVRDASSDFFFPKTEKEILVENLGTSHSLMEKFFSEAAPKILESGNLSKEEKESLINAIGSSVKTGNLIKNLKNITTDEKSIIKAIIEKAFNLSSQTALSPDPTHIPPQCRLECPNE